MFCHAKIFARACRRLPLGLYGHWISDAQICFRRQITKNNTQTKNKIWAKPRHWLHITKLKWSVWIEAWQAKAVFSILGAPKIQRHCLTWQQYYAMHWGTWISLGLFVQIGQYEADGLACMFGMTWTLVAGCGKDGKHVCIGGWCLARSWMCDDVWCGCDRHSDARVSCFKKNISGSPQGPIFFLHTCTAPSSAYLEFSFSCKSLLSIRMLPFAGVRIFNNKAFFFESTKNMNKAFRVILNQLCLLRITSVAILWLFNPCGYCC